MKKYSIVLFLVISFVAINAQEVISNLNYNQALIATGAARNNTTVSAKRNSLSLPFFDDFANKEVYPKADLWVDNFVYINDHLQTNAISYGVATFDGLNQFGRPYNTTTPNAYGTADTLTSLPIDLSAFTSDDTSIYLSFFYQPMGLGDWPNEDDSLLLEFKTLGNNWKEVWASAGFSAKPDSAIFKNVMIRLDDPFYFVNDFQFRFRNLATSGNNDHWHLDYVYLNSGRGAVDSVMRDISVIGIPTRILKNYTAMPWNQFVDNQTEEADTSFKIFYRNNFSDDRNMQFIYDVEETFTNTPLDNNALSFSPFPPFSYFFKEYTNSGFIPFNATGDSVLLTIKQYLDVVNATPLFIENDTSSYQITFYNFLAYDDGTAEKSYGLEGPGLKKFSYEFNLNKPDSLRAIQVHFSHITSNVNDLLFTLFIWKNIDFTTGEEDTLFQEDFMKPIFVDSINGFATFVLDEAIFLEAGRFFVGWQQVDNRNLQIGLDVNNSATNKMRIFSNGSWFSSSVNAAPMIRPILGKQVAFVNTSVKELKQESFVVYPNPADNILKFKIQNSKLNGGVFDIFDLSGKKVLGSVFNAENHTIDISQLPTGTYIVHLKDNAGTNYRPQRFIKLN
jgi:hypothetical protein